MPDTTATATELARHKPLTERLRIGSDILREAATELEWAYEAIKSLQSAIEAEGYDVMVEFDSPRRTLRKRDDAS